MLEWSWSVTGGLKNQPSREVMQVRACLSPSHSPYIPTRVHHRGTGPGRWRGPPWIPPGTPAESACRLRSGGREGGGRTACISADSPAGGESSSRAKRAALSAAGLISGSVRLDGGHSGPIQITKCCCCWAAQAV